MPLNTAVEPVKWMPAREHDARTGSPTSEPEPYTRLITPGGMAASSNSFIRKCAEYEAVDAGYQTTVFPVSAAEVGRLPAMAVKLNGVTAKTNPSSGRYSSRFHTPGEEIGCSS